MKKKYEKPQVYMERFELSQNIALCDYRLGSGDVYSCSVIADRYENDFGDFTGGFLDGACDVPVSMYCYTDGSGSLPSIFVS